MLPRQCNTRQEHMLWLSPKDWNYCDRKLLNMSSGYDSSHEMLGSEEGDWKEWFQEYTAVDGDTLPKDSCVIKVVNSDKLEANFVEQRIRESTPKAPITGGFCAKCQDLFDNWPTLDDSSARERDSKPDTDQDRWEYAITRSCSTFELEGSTRSGYRFCCKASKTADYLRHSARSKHAYTISMTVQFHLCPFRLGGRIHSNSCG